MTHAQSEIQSDGKLHITDLAMAKLEENVALVQVVEYFTPVDEYPCEVVNIPHDFLSSNEAFVLPKGSKVSEPDNILCKL